MLEGHTKYSDVVRALDVQTPGCSQAGRKAGVLVIAVDGEWRRGCRGRLEVRLSECIVSVGRAQPWDRVAYSFRLDQAHVVSSRPRDVVLVQDAMLRYAHS